MKFYSILLALLVPLVSCGGGKESPAPIVVPTTITLNKTDVVLTVNQTSQLTATVNPYSTVTWVSSNPLIATVSQAGLVTAVSKGIVDIVATAKESTAVCKITVPGGSPDYRWLAVGQDQGKAMVWTDRETYDLGIGIARSADKSLDGTLFVAGESDGYPSLWIGSNFEKQILSNAKGKANFVYLKDSDAHVAGQATDRAVYWKNGVQNVLADPISGYTALNTDAKSITLTPSEVFVVGSGEFTRMGGDYVPPTGKMQSALKWAPGVRYPFTGFGGSIDQNQLSSDMIRLINDGSVVYLGTEEYKGEIFGRLNINDSGSQALVYNNEDVYTYDFTPYGNFKIEPSRDNAVLIATSVGVYKMTGVPNKAYAGSMMVMPYELLPGYGYSRSVKLLNNDIYSAGKNLIYKNGSVLTTLSPTAEIYSMLVQMIIVWPVSMGWRKKLRAIFGIGPDKDPNKFGIFKRFLKSLLP